MFKVNFEKMAKTFFSKYSYDELRGVKEAASYGAAPDFEYAKNQWLP
jgi:hypothetical protein